MLGYVLWLVPHVTQLAVWNPLRQSLLLTIMTQKTATQCKGK